jgi:hypothetical protein
MSAASVSLAIGTTAAANVTDGATTFVPPGVSVTIALQSSTGIKRWIVRADNVIGGQDPQDSLGGFSYQADTGGTFSTTIFLPLSVSTRRFVSEVLDSSNNPTKAIFIVSAYASPAVSAFHRAAVVNTTNVNVSNMNVVIDGQTLVAGETVLLVAQTTGAENGLYTCGTVTTNNCALTRSVDLPAGAVFPSPIVVYIEKGTAIANSLSYDWKASNTGNVTIGTTSLTFFPRVVRGAANLASNTVNVTNLWIQSGATGTAVSTNLNATAQISTINTGSGTGNIIMQGANAGGTGAYTFAIINW